MHPMKRRHLPYLLGTVAWFAYVAWCTTLSNKIIAHM
jgi:hypothetical protein